MATRRALARPPIREALIDIAVSGVDTDHIEALRRLHAELRSRYPTMQEQRQMEAKIELKPGGIAAASKQVGFRGVQFKNAAGDRVAQFRRDGFTLNQLGNYISADPLFEEVADLWPRYCQTVQPLSISRIALRYINELQLPISPVDAIERFLTSAPANPSETDLGDLGMSNFQVNIVLHEGGTGHIVTVSQNYAGARPYARYVLDIDAALPGPRSPSTHLRPHLEALRDLKNRVFFSMLTDDALALYDKEL
jgi:uncharacterized protein (TIGR04255 family)